MVSEAGQGEGRPLWGLSAAEVLPRLRSGDLSAVAYTQALLRRVEERDPIVRAWVYINPDLVLQRARELDAIPVAQRKQLHGLPIGVKDVMLTKDMPTQYNSPMFETQAAKGVDANCIMALRAMGAIIMGKTSTTEFASSKQGGWHQNLTCNAHDPKRTPGGSSSGSGAAVGDFQVPVALGTQTGGSIVRPASFNGCYGFKPTWGAISREGLAQWCVSLDTCGFFARSLEDLEVLSDAFRISDDDKRSSTPFSLEGAKVGFCRTLNWPKAGRGTINAMDKAKRILQKHGAVVDEIDLPDEFRHLLGWHAKILSGEGRSSFLGQWLVDKTMLHDNIAGYVEDREGVSHQQLLEAYDGCARLRPMFDSIAKRYDVVITPSVVDEAPTGLDNTGDMSFCSSWTALHVPAINLQGFFGEHGMPIGLTAVTARFMDRHLLHVSRAIDGLFRTEGK